MAEVDASPVTQEEFKPSDEFQEAADNVKKLAQEPLEGELLVLYALFKQVTVGDLDPEKEPKPSMGLMNFTKIKNRRKWEAREKVIGKSKQEAQEEYIENVKDLVEKYGLRE